jgi:D-alanine--poly(phosphoribitol) ligase subunit 1
MNYNLSLPFYKSASRNPNGSALYVDDQEYTYGQLLEKVMNVADWMSQGDFVTKRVGILAPRSAEAYIGILAAAWIGAAYVPINLALPESALIGSLKRSGLDVLIADRIGSARLGASVLAACPPRVLAVRDYVDRDSARSVVFFDSLKKAGDIDPAHVEATKPSYVLYTSGTTGLPKGVIISAGAVDHFLSAMQSQYPLVTEDRVAETTEPSFDISVYNMFATWRAGASLRVMPKDLLPNHRAFICKHEITIWFSVPSAAAHMDRRKMLKANSFPSIRLTFFCGETLLISVAAAWQGAAPLATIVNMYGPTEATVMCLGERYHQTCVKTRDSVAIGRPFHGMKAAVASPELHLVADDETGELLLSGPQLALGYLDDEENDRLRFVHIDGDRWYKTGDLAYRDAHGFFHFLGRVDNQVKVLGYRVELEEIECHLREVTDCKSVAAVAWPIREGSASGIVAFLAGFAGEVTAVMTALRQRLPNYFVPTQIRLVTELPVNNNGKVDRKALCALLD